MNNKKLIISTAGVVSASLLAFGSYELGKHNALNNVVNTPNVAEVKNKSEEKKVKYSDREETTVVSEIIEGGYISIHGDHSHVEKGLIPYNAKFLDSALLKDNTYVLNKDDIQYEVAQGYIIKVKDKYYYYPKENVKQTNIVTKEEAEKITANNHGHSHNEEKKEVLHEKTVTGIPGVTVADSDGFLLTSEGQITGRTSSGIIVAHGSHEHLIPYSNLVGTKWGYLIPGNVSVANSSTLAPRTVGHSHESHEDNYVFDKKDVISEDDNGYTVRHGDHLHYIRKTEVNNNNITLPGAANEKVQEKPKTVVPTIEHKKEIIPDLSTEKTDKIKFPGIDFPTSDKFLFDGTGLDGYSTEMLFVKHGKHTHPIMYMELVNSKWEKLIPEKYLATAKEAYKKYAQEIQDKRVYLAKKENIAVVDIKVVDTLNGKALEYVHENHKHTELIRDIKIEKLPQGITEETTNNYTEEEKEKIKYLAKMLELAEDLITVIDTPEGKALSYPHDDHRHHILLSEIDLEKNVELEHRNEEEAKEDLNKKIAYIAEVYGVPLEAIKVSDKYFIFNDPGHGYDPTHIHPYLIARSKLIIPEVTGDPEVDFENELLAVAERTGLTLDKIKIVNGKFALPHGDHDHYVKIKSTGVEEYYKNKLPAIEGSYLAGELEKETVNSKISELLAETNRLYKDDIKNNRRITRELVALKNIVQNNPSNSTAGYIKMLEDFAAQYIYKNAVENNEDKALITKYNEVLKSIVEKESKFFEKL